MFFAVEILAYSCSMSACWLEIRVTAVRNEKWSRCCWFQSEITQGFACGGQNLADKQQLEVEGERSGENILQIITLNVREVYFSEHLPSEFKWCYDCTNCMQYSVYLNPYVVFGRNSIFSKRKKYLAQFDLHTDKYMHSDATIRLFPHLHCVIKRPRHLNTAPVHLHIRGSDTTDK